MWEQEEKAEKIQFHFQNSWILSKSLLVKIKENKKKFSRFAKTMQFLLSILDMVLFSSFDRLFLG